MKQSFVHWKANFFTGLAIVLPAAASIAVVIWLVEFPRAGLYSIGFITGAQYGEVQHKTKEQVVGVFVPTTPNPTTGFIVLVPEKDIIKLDMSVADGIKYIMSLGSVAPAYVLPGQAPRATAAMDPGCAGDSEGGQH